MKKAIPIQQIINWYYGNYCVRKCYNDERRQDEHYPKLQELALKLKGITMTHGQFLTMMRSDKTICNLSDEEWANRKFSWRRTDCITCKKLGIH